MKKIFIFIVTFMIFVMPVFAKHDDSYYIKFNNKKYKLLYSAKNPDTGGFLNEYYTNGETYNLWTELVAVHHFPNAYSPIDQIKAFREYLGTLNCPSALTFDDKKNNAIIDFIIVSNDKAPAIIEFNVFKYEKSKHCGSVALQYAKRYTASNALKVDLIKRELEKSRKKIVKIVKNAKIPPLIDEEIDKCKIETEENTTKINNEQSSEQQKNEINIQENISLPEEDGKKETEELTNDSKTSEITEEKNEICEPENIEKNTEENVEEIIEEKGEKLSPTEEKEVSNTIINTDNNEEKLQNKSNNNREDTESSQSEKQLDLINRTEIKDDSDEIYILKNENSLEEEVQTKENIIKNEEKTLKTKKEKDYKIVNSKDDYIAKPLSKKEIKKLVKQNNANRKKTYQLVNDKDEYIASPLSKSQMKKRVKEAKKRAKEASKQLQENL